MATNSSSNIATAASGKVLQGQGIGANNAFSTATFPSTATGTGTILRANGTDWSVTTATYPDTTTANQLAVSTATNVVGDLTAGTTGQVLTGVTGAVPAFSATPTVTSITFGAGTALSQYVEGTFTPTIFGSGSAGTTTYTLQSGFYTRIGNYVFYSIQVACSAATGTGNLSIGNLPFTTRASTFSSSSLILSGSLNWPASRTNLCVLSTGGATRFLIGSSGTGVGSANVLIANTSISCTFGIGVLI